MPEKFRQIFRRKRQSPDDILPPAGVEDSEFAIRESAELSKRIASYEIFASKNDGTPKGKRLERRKIMYTYLRDIHGAQTVDDALNTLSDGLVKEEVVRVWIYDGRLLNPFNKKPAEEYHAVSIGYPQLAIEKTQLR